MKRVEKENDYIIAMVSTALVAFFTVLFALWTLSSHAATFFHIPWRVITDYSTILILPCLYASYKIAGYFSMEYISGIRNHTFFSYPSDLKCSLFLLLLVICLFSTREYDIKLILVLFGMITLPLLLKNQPESRHPLPLSSGTSAIDAAALIILVILAVTFTLCANIPDMDDSTFLQIASQTTKNKDLPPLTYDASLGHILDEFRFAPYRISAYETLIALLSEKLGFRLLFVYYYFVPSITSALSVLVAFIFSRWLLPNDRAAILSTLIFLLIMLAWGDSPIAYGSRYLVRIFQGKGLIIALTTPFTILVGQMLIQRPSFFTLLILAAANVCAIGVSSTGLIITLCVCMVLCTAAISNNIRTTVRIVFLISITLFYPLTLAIWLKLQGKAGVSLSEVGSYLPINASLGSNSHESTSLAILLIGYLFFLNNRKYVLCIILLASCLLILNPLASEIMSSFTSRNMSWRLAWAVPVPIFLGVSLAQAFYFLQQKSSQHSAAKVLIAFLAISLSICFLSSKKWVLRSRPNSAFGLPTEKISPSYHDAEKIAAAVAGLGIGGEILAQADIAAWLPIHLPDTGLIMPGHTYPVQLQTILDKHDFNARMVLYNAVNSHNPDIIMLANEIKALGVRIVILPENTAGPVTKESQPPRFSVTKIASISGYSVFRVDYDAP